MAEKQTPPVTKMTKALKNLKEYITEFEERHDLYLDFGFIGDVSGGKSVLPGHVRKLAVARVSEEVFQSFEPGVTITVAHPIDGSAEMMRIVGTIEDGEPTFTCSDAEASEFFTTVGSMEPDVMFWDTVVDVEKAEEAARRKEKKRVKKARQRANRKAKEVEGKEGGKGSEGMEKDGEGMERGGEGTMQESEYAKQGREGTRRDSKGEE